MISPRGAPSAIGGLCLCSSELYSPRTFNYISKYTQFMMAADLGIISETTFVEGSSPSAIRMETINAAKYDKAAIPSQT
ncbi:hypothetical protein NCWK1_1705 [Nostoc cycadae WK-1]|uniref:Uncharacterized protein n=1 Tax=Nostoc cycadae WK-1 TaxID=1861711 RepID=A0A2H6LFF8_9NOSO|nr:hypothetical protein NCWK1_1705 [Nostoc cycadae WK-1]